MRRKLLLRTLGAPLIGAAALTLLLPAAPAAADPPGNNGTVKIGEIDVDNGNANDPHVDCVFEVRFFGFDEDQTATVRFTIHPPSGQGDVLFSDTFVISDDPAGGGQDEDAVLQFDGAVDFTNLFDFDPQPNQGFHVKLTITSEGIPGGVKHKVFWLDCEKKPKECPPKY